jgi:hypothetical protein
LGNIFEKFPQLEQKPLYKSFIHSIIPGMGSDTQLAEIGEAPHPIPENTHFSPLPFLGKRNLTSKVDRWRRISDQAFYGPRGNPHGKKGGPVYRRACKLWQRMTDAEKAEAAARHPVFGPTSVAHIEEAYRDWFPELYGLVEEDDGLLD